MNLRPALSVNYIFDVTAKSYKYALACINIPLAVFAWATPAACLVAQGVPANLPSMVG